MDIGRSERVVHAPTLLKLVPEIHFKIFVELGYADISCLRGTCRYFYRFLSRDQLTAALLCFEDKLVKATLHAPTFSKVSVLDNFCHSMEVPRATFGHILDWLAPSECELRVLPCYGCLNLAMASKFDHFQRSSVLLQRDAAAKISRRCVDCILSSNEALESGTPWIALSDGSEQIRCRKCKQVDVNNYAWDKLPIRARIVVDKLCRRCWRKENPAQPDEQERRSRALAADAGRQRCNSSSTTS